ncbi:MAG TPA: substrate-binding domain-containing protein [Chthoniobacteraceae bacterium]|nr:substrate-binding domain-containing protein [Chthoniobacteraceae bacterium]
MQVYTQSRRPSERTEQFLNDYLSRHPHLPGDRLPSPRQIAAELGVSESTVRGVVRKWLQEGRLRSRKGSGIFIARQTGSPSGLLRIGANVRNERRTSEGWGNMIHAHALEAVLELGPRGSFMSLYSSTEEIDALSDEEVVARCREMDGMIIYQSDPHTRSIVETCRRRGIPYVHLNPPGDDAVSNFVSVETFTAFYRITRTLRESGRKRFAAMIYPELEHSVTVRQRLSGIINGIGLELGRSLDLRIVSCGGYSENHGYTAMAELLERDGFVPDAVLAAGDPIALGAFRALNERGLSIPGEVAVIAGAGFERGVAENDLTALAQPLREMGCELVRMLLEMIDEKRLTCPAKILPVGIRTGSSTTAEESARLEAAFRA